MEMFSRIVLGGGGAVLGAALVILAFAMSIEGGDTGWDWDTGTCRYILVPPKGTYWGGGGAGNGYIEEVEIVNSVTFRPASVPIEMRDSEYAYDLTETRLEQGDRFHLNVRRRTPYSEDTEGGAKITYWDVERIEDVFECIFF